jgi:hypothetical protein
VKADLGRIVIYAKNLEKMRVFYETFFGYESRQLPNDRIVELIPPGSGAVIMLHPVAKGVKTGQVTVKLGFDVKDVEQFRNECLKKGLKFGTVHQAGKYSFSNAKDPDKNSITISSRKYSVP